MTQEGHRIVSPDRIISATAGGQVDFYDFLGFHESRGGTYIADVKGIEELGPYTLPQFKDEWKDEPFIDVWNRDRLAHVQFNDNPELINLRVTKDYMFKKVRPEDRYIYRSFIVPPAMFNDPYPAFCIEVPWSIFTEDDKPFKHTDQWGSTYRWYGVDITHKDVVFHDWRTDVCFPVTDEEVEYRNPQKLLTRMLEDLKDIQF